MSDPTLLDATAAGEALARREVSALELTEAYLTRMERLEPRLNAYIARTAEQARAQASAADARRDKLSPLDGVPLALKDNIDVAGVATTCGMAAAGAPVPAEDAEAVRRLKAAGAVLLGKLNMHEGALGATTDNAHHGRTHNPWRHGFTPGGSSGGSGAAVAARLCAAALGTDTMGSVRLPAAYCGVAGLKPTFGLVSSRGLGLLCGPLDHIGPLARSVRDLGLVLEAMAGVHDDDPFGLAAPAGWRARPDAPASLRGLRVGVVANFDRVETEPDALRAFAAALDLLRREGAQIERIEVPDYDPARARLAGLLWSEADGAAEHAATQSARPEAFSPAFRAMLDFGARAPAMKLAAAQRMLRRAGHEFRRLFERVEVVASPTAAQAAFSFEAKPPANQADLTAPANFAGCPALSLPCGLSSEGLPLGLHLMAAPWREQRLLAVALAVEAALGFDAAPPGPA